jgi:hypothetical protein
MVAFREYRRPAMKKQLLGYAFLPMLSAGSAFASPPAPIDRDAVQRELMATTQWLMDALASGKSEVWRDALADDALIVDEFGRVQGKDEAVASVTGLPPGFSGEIRLLNPRLQLDGDTAVLLVDNDETETVFGQRLQVVYRMLATWVRRDGAWKLLGMQDVTVPTTPPPLQVADLPLGDYPGVYRYAPQRSFTVALAGDAMSYTTRPGRPPVRLLPLSRDVFMDDGDEKNLYLFRRDANGKVIAVIERRKFNDLAMARDPAP